MDGNIGLRRMPAGVELKEHDIVATKKGDTSTVERVVVDADRRHPLQQPEGCMPCSTTRSGHGPQASEHPYAAELNATRVPRF